MEQNLTDVLVNATNATGKNETFVATTSGFLTAYSSLFIMAIVPIFVGSLKSVLVNKLNRETGEVETMSSKDAAMFPLIASGALVGIYLFFKIFSKEYINLLLSAYFFILGVIALAHLLRNVYHRIIPSQFPNEKFHLRLVQEKKQDVKSDSDSTTATSSDTTDSSVGETVVDMKFDYIDLINLGISVVFGIWYLFSKHWVANNVFGLSFSINAIEFLHLNKVITGVILLCGLFLYDIFWVFGTNVMVTVAKNFEAPIKLIFPQDLLESGLAANHFAMLGLGDIVIPGIFIALLLRFDSSRHATSRLYFYCGLFAYALGLFTTIIVMHLFKHAQPALLYLVPACIGLPILLALVRGEISQLFSYEDSPQTDAADKAKDE